MYLKNLDEKTRKYMLMEIEFDEVRNNVYYGKYLNEEGRKKYIYLLKEAVISGNIDSMIAKLAFTYFHSTYQKKKPTGGFTQAAVPHTAPQTLVEGEYNRFYMRGVCLRSIEEGNNKVKVYRAKEVISPRSESESKIGQIVDASKLLNDLRENIGIETLLGLPGGPNSGLSIELIA